MKWYKYDINSLSEEEYEYFYSLMSEEKKNRVDGFRFMDDKKRTVAGEMIVRKAIAQICLVDENSIALKKSENGKPYAKGVNVEFSISHSNDLVVCAVCDKPIGIDVEKIRPVNLSVAKRVCTKPELYYLFGYTPSDSDFSHTEDTEILTRFFELWTKKEAYVKCSGKGLSSGLMVTPECETIYDNGYVISIYSDK